MGSSLIKLGVAPFFGGEGGVGGMEVRVGGARMRESGGKRMGMAAGFGDWNRMVMAPQPGRDSSGNRGSGGDGSRLRNRVGIVCGNRDWLRMALGTGIEWDWLQTPGKELEPPYHPTNRLLLIPPTPGAREEKSITPLPFC